MSLRIYLAAVTAILLSACSGISSADKIAGLDGTGWVLASLPPRALLPGSIVTLNFEDGRISGTDGCNRYSGAYQASDLNLQITSDMAATMMACDEPVMRQATAFLSGLKQVRSYRIAAGQLVLFSADDVLLASLAPQSKGLAGTAWQVIGYNNGRQAVVSALTDTTLSMFFASDGKVSGSAGCNNYSAAYTSAGPALSIGPAATTRKMCGTPPNIMEQEQQFLAALATVASARQEAGRLELRTASGALAVSLARDTAE